MGSSQRHRLGRLPLAVGLACAVGISTSVLADTPKAESSKATSPAGVMTFEHVRVVNAPIAASSAAAPAQSQGLRAYIDQNSKRLREQTPDEAHQVATERRVRMQVSRVPMARSASANAVDDSVGPQMIYGADGSVGLLLDEESMVYQVAHKDANGDVGQQCVNGKTEAAKALQSNTDSKHDEVRHDR